MVLISSLHTFNSSKHEKSWIVRLVRRVQNTKTQQFPVCSVKQSQQGERVLATLGNYEHCLHWCRRTDLQPADPVTTGRPAGRSLSGPAWRFETLGERFPGCLSQTLFLFSPAAPKQTLLQPLNRVDSLHIYLYRFSVLFILLTFFVWH